jgi:hypothetical protein
MFASFQEAFQGTLAWADINHLPIRSITITKENTYEFYSAKFTSTTNKTYVSTWESSQVTFVKISNKEINENCK